MDATNLSADATPTALAYGFGYISRVCTTVHHAQEDRGDFDAGDDLAVTPPHVRGAPRISATSLAARRISCKRADVDADLPSHGTSPSICEPTSPKGERGGAVLCLSWK